MASHNVFVLICFRGTFASGRFRLKGVYMAKIAFPILSPGIDTIGRHEGTKPRVCLKRADDSQSRLKVLHSTAAKTLYNLIKAILARGVF
jgi:hypothetical protein